MILSTSIPALRSTEVGRSLERDIVLARKDKQQTAKCDFQVHEKTLPQRSSVDSDGRYLTPSSGHHSYMCINYTHALPEGICADHYTLSDIIPNAHFLSSTHIALICLILAPSSESPGSVNLKLAHGPHTSGSVVPELRRLQNTNCWFRS